jgi:hypothetical protein
MIGRLAWAALAMLAWAAPALAEERPSEDEMFGPGPAPTPAPAPEPVPPPSAGPVGPSTATATSTATGTATSTESGAKDARDWVNLGSPGQIPALSAEVAPEDPLKIGGQIYLRAQTSAQEDQSPGDWSLTAPSLLDAYMDVRPNDRVRGFVLGRMSYDPTLPDTATSPSLATGGGATGTEGTTTLNSIFSAQSTRTPRVVLDQMWLRFDLLHRVFVTAGRQHVRWGTGRFWTPTDFLHIRRRNPLDVFDARTGTTMVKFHVPWEERGWNFYAYALTENTDATRTLGKVSGAARAEVVLGTAELGLGGVVARGRKPKLAADLSMGIWDLDFYGEAALRWASEISRVAVSPAQGNMVALLVALDQAKAGNLTPLPPAVDAAFPAAPGTGVKPQVTGGVSYSMQYADKDVLTFGGEYFYNGLGYSDPAVYPGLFLPRSTVLNEPASFFYFGRHYAGLFVTAPAPYSWDNTTFTLSNLMNISDRSGITRLDYTRILLTHLRFEAYGALRWGHSDGEFRLGLFGLSSPALFDVGVGLRVAI